MRKLRAALNVGCPLTFVILQIMTGAGVLLYIPFLRRHFRAWNLVPVDKKSFVWALQQKYPFNVTHLTTGGISEMFYGISQEQIILNKRKGRISNSRAFVGIAHSWPGCRPLCRCR